MIAVINICLILLMSSFDKSIDPHVHNIVNNPLLTDAIRIGDLGRAESIVKRLLAEQFSLDLNKQLGRQVFQPNTFWNLLVQPQWLELSQTVLNLSTPLLALNIATQILNIANLSGRVELAKSLATANLQDFSDANKVLPAWSWLSRARDASTKRQASEQLQRERDALGLNISDSYQATSKELLQRWRQTRH